MATVAPDFTSGAHAPNMAVVAPEPSVATVSDPMAMAKMAPPAMDSAKALSVQPTPRAPQLYDRKAILAMIRHNNFNLRDAIKERYGATGKSSSLPWRMMARRLNMQAKSYGATGKSS